MARCPAAAETPLVAMPGLGPDLWVKDERGRMGLGSFKALGAAFRAAHGASDYPSYDTFLSAHGAGASSLDVVARPRHAHLYTPDVVARYLRLEDDVARGKWGD